jgi:hypothetical protein
MLAMAARVRCTPAVIEHEKLMNSLNLDQQHSGNNGLSQDVIDQIQRPSVDTLLDELTVRSTSPVYAVPHDEVRAEINN